MFKDSAFEVYALIHTNVCMSRFHQIIYPVLSSTPKSVPSFQRPVFSDSVPVNMYVQGSPMYTSNDQYFTIPQVGRVHTLSSTDCLK